MKKGLAVVLLVVMFSVTAVAAYAGPPMPYYLIAPGQGCWVPDATGRPQVATEAKIDIAEAVENSVLATCLGILPAGSAVPVRPVKITSEQTKLVCATRYQGQFLQTREFGAIVRPDGTTYMTCLFKLRPV